MLANLSRAPRWVTLFAALLAVGCNSAASRYPNRTVVVICPWAAGGGTDRVARFLADQLQRELGQPVVVQNQTGGSGATGHAAGARARPDGYTITMGTFELSTMRSMGISDLTYRNFQPLAQVNADPAAILVRNDAPWKTLGEFIDDVRSRPGALKMSGTAAGGAWDLARSGLLIAANLPVDAVLWSPSQGAAPSLVELLGGHIDAVCCSLAEAQSQLEAGQLRALCVMSAERLPDHPDVRTVKEDGIDWEAVGWRGLFLPRNTPDEIDALLSDKVQKVIESEPYREFLAKYGFGGALRQGNEFTAFLEEQESRWAKVIEAAGMAATTAKPRVVAAADPGPWFFPSILAAGIALGTCSIVGANVWRGAIAKAEATCIGSRDRGGLDVVLFLVLLTLYLAAIPWLGFFVSTLIFAVTQMVRLGTRWPMALGLSAGLLLIVHLLFVQQFRVVLPTSPWWPL
jgi:tripartite-type tricarboxylate transporter receptor subunit TctC